MGSFGGVIPVLGLNLGFLGNVSRIGERVIASRQVNAATANPINFGDPCIIIPDSVGGTYQSVKDFVTAGGKLTASRFAGVAVRNVKTQLVYSSLGNGANTQIGQFAQAAMAEVLERGSVTVKINVGTPVSQNPLFIRVAADATIPAGVVGGFEASADTNPITAPTISTTSGSTAATVSSAANLSVGMIITSANVPAGTSIVAIAGTNVTLSDNATATAAGTAASFNHLVQLPNVVFKTGVMDGNNVSEITLLTRVAA